MQEKQYNLYNNIAGWAVFAIAAITYLSTMEPTTSLWDCGEFIAASYKLQVVHPPGAPFFLILNRFFSLFAPNEMWVARFVNAQSAFSSAFTILFLFWTITALGKRILVSSKEKLDQWDYILILGSGLVGGLAFTFSDTFWFSAVEGEVYALSSLFMALIFWLMLKWDARADNPGNMRWIILIAFLLGLAIGVHLLSLLVIPVLGFVYYFRKYDKITRTGLLITAAAGFAILAFVLQGVIKTIPFIASRIELLFVNDLGLPFWSGILFTALVVAALLIYGIWYSHLKSKPALNVALVSALVIMMGFSTYTMVVVRSMANPSIDMNNPETVFNLISYLNREQYGDRPLLYGPYFTAELVDYEDGRKEYRLEGDGYKFIGNKRIPKFDPEHQTLFPRMGDTRADRVRSYRQMFNLRKGEKPTFADNLSFFFSYQLGHMYWRYFAWNFVGRQNDEQGLGSPTDGNWMSGIKFLDNLLANVGPQEGIPHWMKVNKARNHLYFLPFILGILGMFFHFKNQERDAYAVLAFFLMTGFMLVIYLNNPPREPRERDYTLVGSFYVFAIWIGLGVFQLTQWLRTKLDGKIAIPLAIGVSLLAVPILMATEEWDDHDRSGRYTTVEFGKNYLRSCDKNAVLFTNGDNDTYPLWYAQEVEGFRTDVRVVNMQLMMTGWYPQHLKKKSYESDGLPISAADDKIEEGVREYILYRNDPSLGITKDQYIKVDELLEFIYSDNPRTKLQMRGGGEMDYFPSKKITIPVNKENAVASGVLLPELKDIADDVIKLTIKKNNLLKSDYLMLDMIATSNWTRPMNYAITAGPDVYLNLGKYLQQTGLVYRLTPYNSGNSNRQEPGSVDVEAMYNNLMNDFEWGGLAERDLYIGSVTRRHCRNYRNLFARMGNTLVQQKDFERAVKVADRCLEVIPDANVPYDISMIPIMEIYYKAEAPDKGKELAGVLLERFAQRLEYYTSYSSSEQSSLQREMQTAMYAINRIRLMATRAQQEDLKLETENILNRYGALSPS